MKYIYYLSLGSNLGDREQYLANAIEGLRRHENIESVTPSKWLETAPWGNTNQGPFLNGACKVVTTLVPEAMLQVMQALEKAAGRERLVHWGPRTLDLDIVWAEKEDGRLIEVQSETLTIPHPYLWDRAFVLVPLSELYPNFIFQGQVIGDRIKELDEA